MCKLHMVGLLVVAMALGAGCSKKEVASTSTTSGPLPATGVSVASLSVTSSSFPTEGAIASKYTCEGGNTSPALAWTDAPPGTKSFVVIAEDPDAPDPAAPKQVFVHWILYNIPPNTKAIAEGAKSAPAIGAEARDGKNDYGGTGWKGPCPPKGRHRYFYRVYALDTVLPDLGEPTKAELEKAMSGHVLAKGEVMGTYEKQSK